MPRKHTIHPKRTQKKTPQDQYIKPSMRLRHHLLALTIIVLVIFILTKSLTASLFCFLTGFLLNTDYLIDYWLYKPKKKITLDKGFLQGFYEKLNKIPIIFQFNRASNLNNPPKSSIPILFNSYTRNRYRIYLSPNLSPNISFANYELHPQATS